MIYLFLGQDSPSKDNQLKKIKQEYLASETEQFNLDVLYARELTLKNLQEKLLFLPVKSLKRMFVIKDAQNLKEELKKFLLDYAAKPCAQIILVLDISAGQAGKDDFVRNISKYARIIHFKETFLPDTFSLNRQIQLKRPDYALRVLNQLLKEGERPERILGGLRYAWEKDIIQPHETKRILKLLLNCDMEIKTGRIKPVFALEKLVVSLCGHIPPKN